MDDLMGMLDRARERLAGVPQARLGAVREPGRIRRVLGGRPAIVPVAAAWHVGVLLIGESELWSTGSVLRAAEEVRRGYTAESQRERAAVRAMAFCGGFAEGEVFHLDWRRIDVAEVQAGGSVEPLSWRSDRLLVRWSRAGSPVPLAAYIDEQVDLIGG